MTSLPSAAQGASKYIRRRMAGLGAVEVAFSLFQQYLSAQPRPLENVSGYQKWLKARSGELRRVTTQFCEIETSTYENVLHQEGKMQGIDEHS